MIHLTKKNGKYYVQDTASNHEPIKTSRALTTRKGAFKNIRSTAKLYSAMIGYELEVLDSTGKEPRVLIVTEDRVYPQDK